MRHARSTLNKSARRGASLLATSALALTVTLGSTLLTVEAFAAPVSPISISAKGRTFNATRPVLKRYLSGFSSSAASRVTPPPKGSGTGSRVPRKPRIIVKRYPVPPVIVTPPPVVVGSGTSAGGAPSSGSGATTSPLRRPGIGGLPSANDRDYLPDEVVIQLAANGADQAARSLAQRFRLTQVESFDVPGANTRLYRWRIPDRRTAPAVVSAVEADRSTVSVSLNYV